MSKGMQGYMGYGVDPNVDIEAELMTGLAGLPNTDVAYDWLLNGGPQGEMIGDVFVPPSWTQYAADAAKTGIGAMMLNNRNQKAQELAKLLQGKLAPSQSSSTGPLTEVFEVDMSMPSAARPLR